MTQQQEQVIRVVEGKLIFIVLFLGYLFAYPLDVLEVHLLFGYQRPDHKLEKVLMDLRNI
jgi:hypothetical protein